MARIERFEDIEAWAKARELTRESYRVTNEGLFARDSGLRDPIRRVSVSIEVQPQRYVAMDTGYLLEQQFEKVYALAQSTGNLIGGFIAYLTTSAAKGGKFT